MYKIEGTIRVVGSEQIVSEKFRKREIVLEVPDGKFYQHVKLEFVQNNCSVLEGFASGESVEIHFYVKGREWIDRNGNAQYFNTLQGFNIRRAGETPAPSPQGMNPGRLPSNPLDIKGRVGNIESNFQQDAINEMEEDDDLPF